MMLKKHIIAFSTAAALLITGCDLFQTSLADYLYEFPKELRLDSLWAEHDSQIFYPLEAIEPGRDTFTIVVTPKMGIAIALHADVADASSTVSLPTPWNAVTRPAPVVEGIQSYWKYRDDEEKHITVNTASGASKTYTVRIVWAKLIDDPAEINGGLSQDYYLRPGPPIELPADWLPIGVTANYASSTSFLGSLRGNGRTIRIRGFEQPLGYAINQGLFGEIQQAWIEDLHVELDAVSTNAKNSGGLAGLAAESVIQRVKVSGGINNTYSGAETNVGGITGSLSGKTVIRDSLSTVNVSGSFTYTISGNAWEHFYMGGITGNQVHTSGGYIFRSYAGGTVIALTPATVGGISGGGGTNSNTTVKGCVAMTPRLDALSSGRVKYILAQWDGPTALVHNAGNYYYDQIDKTGNDATPHYITGTPKTAGELRQQSTYVSLGWNFTSVWKMNGNGYPALFWE
jgi:hypothetical protein